MTLEVPLTKGFAALIDDEDWERVSSAGSWCAHQLPHTTYAMRATRRPDGRRTTIRLHTFLTGHSIVDHINGDGLDNRRANLRPANAQQNMRNRRKTTSRTSSQFKGVHWDRPRGLWIAQIKVDRRNRHLGQFTDEVEAARAYDAAAVDLFGEFARLNLSTEDVA